MIGLWLCFHVFLFSLIVNEYNCYNPKPDTIDTERPGRDFCKEQFRYKDVNCTNQVKTDHDSQAFCLMKYYNNSSTDCSDSAFEGEVDTTEENGFVNLSPIPWFFNNLVYSTINITFTNIQWKSLKMRVMKYGSPTPTFCREFIVSENLNSSSVISFDCLWDKGDNVGLPYIFQYVLRTRDDHQYSYTYLFRLPAPIIDGEPNESPENHIFMVMDITTLSKIGVKLQVPPSKFHISSTNVTLFYKEEKQSQAEYIEKKVVSFTEHNEGDFIPIEPFNTYGNPGLYYFNASFYHCKNNHCIETSTPLLKISGPRLTSTLIISIILATVLFFGVVAFLTWRNSSKKIDDSIKPRKVLFMYDSTYPDQVKNMYKMKEFFEKYCGVVIKLDLKDLPRNESMAPLKWYCQAFEEADCVLLFASPSKAEKGIHEDNVYNDLYSISLNVLGRNLLKKKALALVQLPGSSFKLLPDEWKLANKKFYLPRDLIKMLKFIKVAPVINRRVLKSLLKTELQLASVADPSRPSNFDTNQLINDSSSSDTESDCEVRHALIVGGHFVSMAGESHDDYD